MKNYHEYLLEMCTELSINEIHDYIYDYIDLDICSYLECIRYMHLNDLKTEQLYNYINSMIELELDFQENEHWEYALVFVRNKCKDNLATLSNDRLRAVYVQIKIKEQHERI